MTTVGEGSKAKRIDVVVRAMIGRGEQLLLIRHPEEGHWYLPGGQVDPGQPAEAALRRKITNALDTEIESASFLAVGLHAGLRSGRFDTGDRWLPWGSAAVH